eukprot:gnl/Chilomastix_caulleri/2873.p1 GENE.gnl/Chilomastix_caulleri/2873~~gnl/Chilomastix_caulleri/2873.p1  ORF type:complete len:75 (+),score=5.99 gnl/Chilomastix_caulleri/2873:82-306(+)
MIEEKMLTLQQTVSSLSIAVADAGKRIEAQQQKAKKSLKISIISNISIVAVLIIVLLMFRSVAETFRLRREEKE